MIIPLYDKQIHDLITRCNDSKFFRNRVVNGSMIVGPPTPSATFTTNPTATTVSTPIYGQGPDMMIVVDTNNAAGASITVQKTTGEVVAASTNLVSSLKVAVASVPTSTVAPDTQRSLTLQHRIEGTHMADLGWGLSSSTAPVTVSLYFNTNVLGTYGISVRNAASTRVYTSTFTVTVAGTWLRYSVTIPAPPAETTTVGVWTATEGVCGMIVDVSLSCDVTGTMSAPLGNNVWQTIGTNAGAVYATGTTAGFRSAVGNYAKLSGLQVERGRTATQFEYRPMSIEQTLCHRYITRIANCFIAGYVVAGSVLGHTMSLPLSMMTATPSITYPPSAAIIYVNCANLLLTTTRNSVSVSATGIAAGGASVALSSSAPSSFITLRSDL